MNIKFYYYTHFLCRPFDIFTLNIIFFCSVLNLPQLQSTCNKIELSVTRSARDVLRMGYCRIYLLKDAIFSLAIRILEASNDECLLKFMQSSHIWSIYQPVALTIKEKYVKFVFLVPSPTPYPDPCRPRLCPLVYILCCLYLSMDFLNWIRLRITNSRRLSRDRRKHHFICAGK